MFPQGLTEFEYHPTTIFVEFGAVLVLQIALYFIAAGSISSFYGILSGLGVGSRLEQRPRRSHQVKTEILWSLSACTIIAVYFYGAFAFIEDVYPKSWSRGFLNVIVFMTVYDFYMYVSHRLLHGKMLRKFHARHHTAVSATPWSCINIHPVEALINYLPFLVFAMAAPISLIELLGIHAYLIFGIANGHGNYSVVQLSKAPFLLRELTSFHQKHHSDGRRNYGYLFTHWDFIFGTRHG